MTQYLKRQNAPQESPGETCPQCRELALENALLVQLVEKYVVKTATLMARIENLEKAIQDRDEDA